MAATTGKLEVIVKFGQLPEARTVPDGHQEIALDCGGRLVTFTLKPKLWKKLTDAERDWPGRWVAAVSGQMGPVQGTGFVLLEPNLQVFEKKPKVATGAGG